MPEISFVYQLFLERNLWVGVSFGEKLIEVLQNRTTLSS